jgi:hypothetical protein
MKRTQILVPLSLVLAGILILAAPAAAKSTRTPYDFYEVLCVESPGIQWQAGNTLHVRGQVNQNILYDAVTFENTGSNTVIANVNVNLTTGRQQFFGTYSAVLLPESASGTFDGTWHATLETDGSFLGKAVGQGADENRGKKGKFTLNGVDPNALPPELLIILSQPPWTECQDFGGIFRDIGFIHKRGK